MEILKKLFNPTYVKDGLDPLNKTHLAGSILVSQEHHIFDISAELAGLMGIPKDATTANAFLMMLHEEDREMVSRFLDSKDNENTDDNHFTCRIQTDKLITLLGIKGQTYQKTGFFFINLFDVSDLAERNGTPGKDPDESNRLIDSSLSWLNHIFENKAAGIVILSKEGKFLKANQTYLDLLGYTEEELVRLTVLDLTPKQDWDICMEKMGKLSSGVLESAHFEKRMTTRSGALRWLEVNATAITQTNKYILCFFTDIHEKKQALEKLKEREEQLRQAKAIAKIGSWSLDLSTMTVSWSEGMYNLMELPDSYQPSFESLVDLMHPEDLPLFERKIKSLEEFTDLEIRHLTKSGVKYVLINSRVDYENGIPVRLYGTSQDVSERWFVNKRLQLIENTAKLGWWEANLVTDESVWSDSLYELLGLDKTTAKPSSETFLSNMHPDDIKKTEAIANDAETLKNGWHNVETRHRSSDGTYKYLLSSGHYVWDSNRPIKVLGTVVDISQAKEAQIRLDEAQQIARFGWWEANLVTGESIWSDSMYELHGLVKATTRPGVEPYLKSVHPDDLDEVMALLNDPAVMGNGWHNKELRHILPDGTIKYFLVNANAIMDGDHPIKLIGTNVDVTALKATQLKLEQAQKIAKLGWWEADLTGVGNHWFSGELTKILELSGDNAITCFEDFLSFVHPDDVPAVTEAYQDAVTKNGWSKLVHRIRRKSGDYKYITSSATVEFIERNAVRLLGSIYDVTEFKEIELRLEKNLVNMEAMVTSLDSLIMLIDDQFRFREAFCADASELGFDPYELVGQNAIEALLNQFNSDELLRRYNNVNIPTSDLLHMVLEGVAMGPFQYKLTPESEYWWEIKMQSFQGLGGKRWITFGINNITTRKHAEEELIKGVQKEKELSEMRSQFVSMASHQFRTPLTVIKSNMQLLELTNVKHPVVDKVRHRLQSEVDRLVNLMEDIMTMGKVQSNSVETNFQPVKVSALVKQVKLVVESQQPDQRLLKFSVKGSERPVNLDARFMEQALQNLIENAFKYSANAADPEIKLTYGNEKLRISVIDKGIGIPQEDRAALFTSFMRGANAQHIPGTGLGLAVTKEFIRLNQGTIFLNTQRKTGTEFCIDLPYNA